MNIQRFLNFDNLTRVGVLAILVILIHDHIRSSPQQSHEQVRPSPIVSVASTSEQSHEQVLRFILQHEGERIQRERGHGSYSHRGITQTSWVEWRAKQGDKQNLPDQVRDADISATKRFYYDYFSDYHVWDVHPVLQLLYADFTVLSGHEATKELQRVVGVEPDGVWGSETAAAVHTYNATLMTHEKRLAAFESLDKMKRDFFRYLGKHPNHKKDVKGWLQRADDLRAYMQPYL